MPGIVVLRSAEASRLRGFSSMTDVSSLYFSFSKGSIMEEVIISRYPRLTSAPESLHSFSRRRSCSAKGGGRNTPGLRAAAFHQEAERAQNAFHFLPRDLIAQQSPHFPPLQMNLFALQRARIDI